MEDEKLRKEAIVDIKRKKHYKEQRKLEEEKKLRKRKNKGKKRKKKLEDDTIDLSSPTGKIERKGDNSH